MYVFPYPRIHLDLMTFHKHFTYPDQGGTRCLSHLGLALTQGLITALAYLHILANVCRAPCYEEMLDAIAGGTEYAFMMNSPGTANQ